MGAPVIGQARKTLTLAAAVISVFTRSWYLAPVSAILLLGGTMAMLGVKFVIARTVQVAPR